MYSARLFRPCRKARLVFSNWLNCGCERVCGSSTTWTRRLPQSLALSEASVRARSLLRTSQLIITAVGPFVVANVATRGSDALGAALKVLTAVAIVPALGSLMALFAPFVVETKDRVTE